MKEKLHSEYKALRRSRFFWFFIFAISGFFILFFIAPITVGKVSYEKGSILGEIKEKIKLTPEEDSLSALDKEDYDRRMILLANNPPKPEPTIKKIENKDGTITEEVIPAKVRIDRWPVKTEYPKDGALLPFNRIIAYYGNLYSKKMGVLGEYPEDIMLAKLQAEVLKWNTADPETKAIPALHYIAVVAQGSAGNDGKYRFRMPEKEIDKVLEMAKKIDAIVFLDIQVALSSLQSEIPVFEKYLKMPNVHLGLDPEFSMKTGKKPGSVIGTFDAQDINFATEYLAKIVKENNLPPKILVIHRFTRNMVTNYQNIKIVPEVQFVMHMDGWGHQARKLATYKQFIYPEPVQFTGFKIFYKNDLKEANSRLLTPEDLLKLNPIPIYIQYQ